MLRDLDKLLHKEDFIKGMKDAGYDDGFIDAEWEIFTQFFLTRFITFCYDNLQEDIKLHLWDGVSTDKNDMQKTYPIILKKLEKLLAEKPDIVDLGNIYEMSLNNLFEDYDVFRKGEF